MSFISMQKLKVSVHKVSCRHIGQTCPGCALALFRYTDASKFVSRSCQLCQYPDDEPVFAQAAYDAKDWASCSRLVPAAKVRAPYTAYTESRLQLAHMLLFCNASTFCTCELARPVHQPMPSDDVAVCASCSAAATSGGPWQIADRAAASSRQ